MIRIVLIEYEPGSAQDIQGKLQRMSYEVTAVTATADDVITHADDLQPDIILMDFRLKGETDGVEAAQEIKRLHDIPIIFITADTDEATVRRAIAAEPDGFLIKPLDELELLAAIDVAIKKHQKERQARASERRIRELTDSLAQIIYETDANGAFTYVNAACFPMFGYTKEEFEAGMTVFLLIAPADKERARTLFRRRIGGEDLGQVEYIGLRKDGSTFPIAILDVLIKRDAAVVGMRGVIIDITELKRAEDEIKASLKELETLLKEIHHRVKNNMQIISSLLSLQAAQATEQETIEMLNESQRRIRSMALIHETLYRSGSLAEIDFGEYVEGLIQELLRMYNVPLGVITITTDIKNIQFGVDTAIPCALIINELVSNSLKYAFPDGRTGEATIALHRINGTYELTVADNGVGLPSDLDVQETDTLGLKLVTALVNQLDGTIMLDRTKGTSFIITFKPQGAHVERVGEHDHGSHR